MKFFNKKLNMKLIAGVVAVFVFMLVAMPAVSLANNHTTTFTNPPTDPGGTGDPGVGTNDPGGIGDPGVGSSNIKVINPIGSKVNSLNGFIKILLEGIIKIGIPIVAIALVYSGFLFVSAVGDPGKLKKAKDAFIYCLAGAAILLGSWALAQMISDTVLQIK